MVNRETGTGAAFDEANLIKLARGFIKRRRIRRQDIDVMEVVRFAADLIREDANLRVGNADDCSGRQQAVQRYVGKAVDTLRPQRKLSLLEPLSVRQVVDSLKGAPNPADIARATGVSITFINRLIAGKRRYRSHDEDVEKLARFLGLELERRPDVRFLPRVHESAKVMATRVDLDDVRIQIDALAKRLGKRDRLALASKFGLNASDLALDKQDLETYKAMNTNSETMRSRVARAIGQARTALRQNYLTAFISTFALLAMAAEALAKVHL
jgi:transcriptional regulator with XRE-family HTH domain